MTRFALSTLVTVAVMVIWSTAAPAEHAIQNACKPRVAHGATYNCGPASGRLSVFPGAIFKGGSCVRSTVGGQTLTVELGALSFSKPALNDGKTYLQIVVSGPLSHPTEGHVIAWWHSKRWSGTGISFKGNAAGGSFVAKAVPPAHGIASGSFRCS